MKMKKTLAPDLAFGPDGKQATDLQAFMGEMRDEPYSLNAEETTE